MSYPRYPLKLLPVCKEAVWGGDLLKRRFGKACDLEKAAESWELTVRPQEQSRIENGACAGMTLGAYLQTDRFPLLVKLIDANDRLSIQVHPDDAYAAQFGERGKTEMWVILEAQPGAMLTCGLRAGATVETFAEAVAAGKTEAQLREVPVRPGDVFFLPAGLVHAIGAGILLAEIQQNSDLTYRVYDYNRPGLDGKPRPLHIRQALDVIRPYTPAEIEALQFSRQPRQPGLLAACDCFTVRRLEIPSRQTIAARDGFCHLLCLKGSGTVGGEPIRAGDSYFLPEGLTCEIAAQTPLCLLQSESPA